MIELKSRPERFLKENHGLANGQYFFNKLNNVKFKVIPFFKPFIKRKNYRVLKKHLNLILNDETSFVI
jgi:hypothetical protein